MAPSTLRTSACAHTAPNRPVLAPMTAAGLPRRTVSATGREAQSRAFLSTPGIEWLYSGVEMRTASARSMASLSAWHRGALELGRVLVGVVGRDRPQAVEQLELDSGRQQLCRRPKERRVVRILAQTSRDAEDPHLAYASWRTNSRWTASVTFLPSASPPLGSGAFQLRS